MKASEPGTVPADLRGVWERTLLQTDTEAIPPTSDTTTWVRWLQTSLWHGDLRVPEVALAGREVKPLRELSAAQLAALAEQQGFCGLTAVEALPEGEVCNWLRRFDLQPPGSHPDAGFLVFETPDRLIELGVHQDYTEVWQRLPDSTGRFMTLAGLDAQSRDDGRRLLLAGTWLMLMRPRVAGWPAGMPDGTTLAELMLVQPERAPDWLDMEISFGRFDAGLWCIERSSLPEREGLCLPLRVRCDQAAPVTRAQVALAGHEGPWRVVEWGIQGAELA
jgi:hypothetical protein